MRIEPPPRSRFETVLLALAVGVGSVLAALAASWPGALAALGISVALAVALSRRRRRRFTRRARLVAQRFPSAWRELLREGYDHYVRLPPPLRTRFENDLRLLVEEKRITGVGIEVTDELRVLVAASAVTLSCGWPEYEWDQLSEVLLYPDDFDRDYEVGHSDLAGQAHGWGTLILSVPALREGFSDPDDAYHVGLHEFAHLLDVEGAQFDGLPSGFDDQRARRFVALREREMERLRRGKSVLDEYGASDPVEFFPVAVEAFFEAALALRKRHRELYELLAAYFQQDPAAWDDARGLTFD